MEMGYVYRDPEYGADVLEVSVDLHSPGLSGPEKHQFFIPLDQILNPEVWPQKYKGWHIPFRTPLKCHYDEL